MTAARHLTTLTYSGGHMAKSKVTSIRPVDDLRASLDAAYEKFGEIRGELVVSSFVLSDSSFGGGNSINEEHDVQAVLVLERAVAKLSALQSEIDSIRSVLALPKAIALIQAEHQAVANG